MSFQHLCWRVQSFLTQCPGAIQAHTLHSSIPLTCSNNTVRLLTIGKPPFTVLTLNVKTPLSSSKHRLHMARLLVTIQVRTSDLLPARATQADRRTTTIGPRPPPTYQTLGSSRLCILYESEKTDMRAHSTLMLTCRRNQQRTRCARRMFIPLRAAHKSNLPLPPTPSTRVRMPKPLRSHHTTQHSSPLRKLT
jgi:hypothetical protein